MKELTNQNYHAVMASEKPVLIDFWAAWCGPCKMISPHIEAIAAERPDIEVYKCDADSQWEILKDFKVVLLPTLMLLKGGKVAGEANGYMEQEEIRTFVDEALKK